MSNKQIKTEKIKNMMIVVLLITAILLLSFFGVDSHWTACVQCLWEMMITGTSLRYRSW